MPNKSTENLAAQQLESVPKRRELSVSMFLSPASVSPSISACPLFPGACFVVAASGVADTTLVLKAR